MSADLSGPVAASGGPEDRIRVCVRVRPVGERDRDEALAWEWSGDTISPAVLPGTSHTGGAQRRGSQTQQQQQQDGNGKTSYTFDHLFTQQHRNPEIFDRMVRGLLHQVLEGYHGSVFTYGQTSSGKTFTMSGSAHHPGIIPLAVAYCFDCIHSQRLWKAGDEREFLVRVSYLEIYNEQIKDLLNNEGVVPIKIQYDAKSDSTVVTGIKEQVVVNAEQTMALIKAGEAHRHVGATDMNAKSSRAHTLCKLTVESRVRGDSNTPVRVSSLNLVDLAGSENAKQTNSKGERQLEAKYINQSLLTLSTIIHRLSEEMSQRNGANGAKRHMPYRDSKLTRMLQDSLSGNAHIAVICTINPTVSCFDESNNTLKFASRAKSIKLQARLNEGGMDEKTLLRVYRQEIETLKAKLSALENQSKIQMAPNPPVSSSASVATSLTTVDYDSGDEVDEREQDTLLQMITEMENLILKADKPKSAMDLLASPAPVSGPASSILSPSSSIASSLSAMMQSPAPANPSPASASASASLSSPPSSSSSKIATLKKTAKTPSVSSISSSAASDSVKRTTSASSAPAVKPKTSPLKSSFPGLQKSSSSSTASSSTATATATVTAVATEKKTRFGFTSASQAKVKQPSPLVMESPGMEQIISFPEALEGLTPTSDAATNENRKSLLQRVQSFKSQAGSTNGEENDKVLTGVSKMLAALKHHIEKSRNHHSSHNSLPIPIQSIHFSSLPSASSSSLDVTSTAKMEQLELDLRLRDADNRFLQEELEKKDKMLAMLTEGLREVETSQYEWLHSNQELSIELEHVLIENDYLQTELNKMKRILDNLGIEHIPAPFPAQHPLVARALDIDTEDEFDDSSHFREVRGAASNASSGHSLVNRACSFGVFGEDIQEY